MTFQQEIASWNPFAQGHKVDDVPEVGESTPCKSQLHIPRTDNKPVLVSFLRHCGCPFAEKSFRLLRTASESNPDIHFVAVSHSDDSATSKWVQAVGGAGRVEVIVDYEREIYSAFGLGFHSFWHNLNPWSMSSVFRLGRSEQIWNRPTESGSRWQTSGIFSISKDGVVRYAHIAQAADDLGDLEKALSSLKS